MEARFRVSARSPYPLKEDQIFWIHYDGHIVIALNLPARWILMNVISKHPWNLGIETKKAREWNGLR